ncbi:MAG TPA: asparaginase [Gemmatimonadales bacterium]|nr:asparaginase [Gemmatimonadales bacterium]
MTVLHLLAAGGTIAMQRSAEAGGNVPALDGRGLVAIIGDLGAAATVRVEDWDRSPAVHRGPAELWALRGRVAALVAEAPPPAGIVITHGTDTLEEAAYLLARTVPPAVPVVLTGAMRTSSDADWDGPRNLRDAVRVAADAGSRGRGAMVVFAGKILDGREATKLDAFSPDAFGAPHGTPLGAVDGGGVRFSRVVRRDQPLLSPASLSARVAMIPLVLGDDGALLDCARPGFDGAVLQGFGRGNVPPGVVPAIRRWQDAGKPVVLASRCPFGEAGGEYAFDGGGGQLLRMGVIAAGPRTPAQARLELALCLSAGAPYGGPGPA